MGVLDDIVQSRGYLRVQHFKIREIIARATDHDDFNSSTESTISTSLIHNMASEGKSEQVVTWLLNLIFQHKNDWRVRNLSN